MDSHVIDRDAVASKAIFPFEELPLELRLRVYDFLGLVHPDYLSIHDILEYPKIIRKVPRALAKEMFDMYIGKNRFSINCRIGLPQLLAAAGDTTVSKIRHLRLVHGGCIAHKAIDIDVDLMRDEPWFKIRFVHGYDARHDFQDEVHIGIIKALQALLPLPSASANYFDTNSLKELARQWVLAKGLCRGAYCSPKSAR